MQYSSRKEDNIGLLVVRLSVWKIDACNIVLRRPRDTVTSDERLTSICIAARFHRINTTMKTRQLYSGPIVQRRSIHRNYYAYLHHNGRDFLPANIRRREDFFEGGE